MNDITHPCFNYVGSWYHGDNMPLTFTLHQTSQIVNWCIPMPCSLYHSALCQILLIYQQNMCDMTGYLIVNDIKKICILSDHNAVLFVRKLFSSSHFMGI